MLMKKLKYLLFLLSMAVMSGMAQTAKSGYFLDGTLYSYQLNPAMDAERGFFSLLAGNMSMGTSGNVGISNFLYPYGDDKLTTFMSGTVAADKFLGRLPKAIRLGTDVNGTLLAAGFRMFGGYTTFGVTVHSSLSVSLPKGFFEFAKKGFSENAYSFGGMGLNTMNYAAATIGHSREIIDGLRVGVNLKYLVGLAYANATIDKLDVEMNEQHWMVQSQASANAALISESRLTVDENGVISGVETGPFAPSASGFGVDLGVVYDMKNIVPGLTLSASVIDMGRINWKYMMGLEANDASVEFDGFEEIDPNDFEGSTADELAQLGEDAAKMLELQSNGLSSMSTKLNTTMYLGAEYNMPFYTPLSVAVLYGKRFSEADIAELSEFRGYVNIAPLKWLEASVNVGHTTFGTSLGWMVNVHPAGANFFIGSDYMITKVTPQFIPVNNFNSHITLGVNVTFGERK